MRMFFENLRASVCVRLEGLGIETFINALLSVIGDSGTLISPTLTYRFVTEENPVFDYINTPSCVGAISEFIRHMDGAKRSIHPTHSCAVLGAKTDFYVSGHENDRTPVGINSPIYKLHQDGGKVLMLGCNIGSNTSMHGVEEKFGAPYLLPDIPSKYRIILPGREYEIDFYRHHIKQHGFAQRYQRLVDVLEPKYMPFGKVHGAVSYLIDAPQMWRAGFEALKKDEFFFVDKIDNPI